MAEKILFVMPRIPDSQLSEGLLTEIITESAFVFEHCAACSSSIVTPCGASFNLTAVQHKVSVKCTIQNYIAATKKSLCVKTSTYLLDSHFLIVILDWPVFQVVSRFLVDSHWNSNVLQIQGLPLFGK